MTAYVMFIREEPYHDEAAIAEYTRLAIAGMGESKANPLVANGAIEALEGDAPNGVVMVSFPTMEDARAWYNSPGYQAAIPFRKKGSNYRVFLVEGR
jgi:uncharacterized protein (DUF1330 family)